MTPTSNARYLGHVISEPLQIMSLDIEKYNEARMEAEKARQEREYDEHYPPDPDPEELPDQDYDSQPTKYDP